MSVEPPRPPAAHVLATAPRTGSGEQHARWTPESAAVSWWGKVVGGAFGFMLGGPLGALFGAAVGHQFDRGLKSAGPQADFDAGPERERIQAAFFTATFSVMGRLAKADGRVNEEEIALARAVMRQLTLDPTQERVARELFGRGKQPGFDLEGVLTQLRHECRHRHTLLQMFLEIQLHAAYADGALHRHEAALLQHIAARLGFSHAQFAQLEAFVRAERHFAGATGGDRRRPAQPPRCRTLEDAYAILGVSAGASDAEVKKAYRRLMNQHHPDKLVSKGLPEEMIRVATERTQEIKRAYETIRETRGGST
jgi:DnaJ like chaperone protein